MEDRTAWSGVEVFLRKRIMCLQASDMREEVTDIKARAALDGLEIADYLLHQMTLRFPLCDAKQE